MCIRDRAMLSDRVPPRNRALAFGIVFAGYSFSIVVGPYMGTGVSTTLAFWFSAGVAGLFWLACLATPETLPRLERIPFTGIGDLNPFRVLRVLLRYKMFVRLALVVFVAELLTQGRFDVIYPYMKAVFSITPSKYKYVSITFGISGIFIQSIGMKVLVARCSNVFIMNLALICFTLTMAIQAIINRLWQIYPLEFLSAFMFLSFPAISAMKSNNVSSHEQGKIQGALYGVKQLGGGVGPLVFGAVFERVSQGSGGFDHPELIWWLAVAVGLVAIGLGFSVPNTVSADESQAHAMAEQQQREEELTKQLAREENSVALQERSIGRHTQLHDEEHGQATTATAGTLRRPLIHNDTQTWD